jgi:hypothetical protein
VRLVVCHGTQRGLTADSPLIAQSRDERCSFAVQIGWLANIALVGDERGSCLHLREESRMEQQQSMVSMVWEGLEEGAGRRQLAHRHRRCLGLALTARQKHRRLRQDKTSEVKTERGNSNRPLVRGPLFFFPLLGL